ncbi:Vacuolar protein sorting-associated protein 52 A, partial [Mucuna pruriens]
MKCHNCQKLGHYARKCLAGEGAKNKPNNCVHLAQDEGTDSDSKVVLLMTITSNETQPRILIEEEELTAAPVFNKAYVIRRPLQLKDQELFQDSTAVTEEKWLKAKEEINSIEKNQTWELVDPPSNKKPIALKWVYQVKVNPRGEVVKNKVKLMAKGFLHKAGIDYGEVYAPVARIGTIRLVVAIATNASWFVHQLEEVYVDQLQGFVIKDKENKVYKLKKALYASIQGCKGSIDPTHYRKIVGCVRHLCNTRPNLSFSVGLISRFMQEPRQSHLLAAKRILRYVQRTIGFGVLFPKGEAEAQLDLIGYSDLDWCGDKSDRKSIVGYIFFYGGVPISWSSTKEPVVALSSCENIATSEIACQALIMSRRRIPCLDSYLDKVNISLWPRFKMVFDMHLNSLRNANVKTLWEDDVHPHYVMRRYAEFTASLIHLNAECGDGQLDLNLERLRMAVDDLLIKLAKNFPKPKLQTVFLINNYDMTITVLKEAGPEGGKIQMHFEELLKSNTTIFVIKERGKAEDPTSSLDKPITVAEVEPLVKDFASRWKAAIELMHKDVITSFSNFLCGMEILRAALTQLLLYYTRLSDCIKRIVGGSALNKDLVSISSIMYEIRKYSRTF